MELRTPSAQDIKDKVVLIRCDFNVPLKKQNTSYVVTDETRIELAQKTIAFALKHAKKTILISHLGRPKNKKDPEASLKPVGEHLEKILKRPVIFLSDCVGVETARKVSQAPDGSCILLENLRYHAGEQQDNDQFAKDLAKLADVYINEAFSAAHRAHASIVGIPRHLPAFAGFSLETEVTELSKLLTKPKHPFVVVLGGAKISDKVGAVKHLANIADIVLIGGAIANNFLSAEGYEIYRSYTEEASADLKKQGIDYVSLAKDLITEHQTEKHLQFGYIPLPKLLYPIDVLAAPSMQVNKKSDVQTIDLTHDMQDTKENVKLSYFDIGPQTAKLYAHIIMGAGTIFWNGPMGVWEQKEFSAGTRSIAKAITMSKAHTVLGGGDTIAAAHHFHVDHKFSYVSAAGGAALTFLSGKTLPGIKPLLRKYH